MGGDWQWKVAGKGTVSADGRTISSDPGAGIPRFCGVCGLMCAGKSDPPQVTPPPPDPPCDPTDPCACSGGAGPASTAGNPVTLATGQELSVASDYSCGGRTPIGFARSYNPLDAFNNIAGTATSLGYGWTPNHDVVLLPFEGPQKRIVLPGNRQVNLVDDGAGNYRNSDDRSFEGAALKQEDANTWKVTFKDGRLWRFKPFPGIPGLIRGGAPYFLVEDVDARGNVLSITRNSVGRATAIGTPERSISLSYGANGFVSEITDPLGRKIKYTYNGQDRLETVTNAEGGVTRYSYVDDNEFAVCTSVPAGERLKSIQYPGQTGATVNHYGTGRRVLRQVLADGSELRFNYKVLGACVMHLSNPQQRCSANCPDTDSWDTSGLPDSKSWLPSTAIIGILTDVNSFASTCASSGSP